MKKIIAWLLITMFMFSVTGCQSKEVKTTEPAGLQKVVFTLDWFPNTNHTGVYVAKDKGYFKEEGLDVDIIQPGESTSDQLVASGSAQFGISYQEGVTFARAEGIPIVSLAAVIQHNTSGFMSMKDKNILSPKDFEGKKYGGWGSPIELATIQYLMTQVGADPSKVEVVTIGDTDFFAASKSGEVDFSWVFEGWSVIEAKNKEIDVNYIDLGKEAVVFDYYTPVIITSEKNIGENPELVKKFMKAISKGYEFAIANPNDAAQILLDNAPELDKKLVVDSQNFLAGKYKDDAPYWGYQNKDTWSRYTKWLYDNAFIAKDLDATEFFTNDFISQ